MVGRLRPTFWDTEDTVAALSRGGVLLLNTDTLPGFHCKADNRDAVERVAEIKGRDDGKPLLVLAGSLEQAQSVCRPLEPWQQKICDACWPGPFSLILPVAASLAQRVSAGTGNVAIRVPAHEDLRALILAVGVPLVSTSVNKQGDPPILSLDVAHIEFGELVDGVWNSAIKPHLSTNSFQASALVDLSGKRPRLLREGPTEFPGNI